MTQQFSEPECLRASHSTDRSILEEKPSMHGTTSLLVSDEWDAIFFLEPILPVATPVATPRRSTCMRKPYGQQLVSWDWAGMTCQPLCSVDLIIYILWQSTHRHQQVCFWPDVSTLKVETSGQKQTCWCLWVLCQSFLPAWCLSNLYPRWRRGPPLTNISVRDSKISQAVPRQGPASFTSKRDFYFDMSLSNWYVYLSSLWE